MSERNQSNQTARSIAEVIETLFARGGVPTGVDSLDEHLLHYTGDVCLVHGHFYASRWLLLSVVKEALLEDKSVLWVDLRSSEGFVDESLALLSGALPSHFNAVKARRAGVESIGLRAMRRISRAQADFDARATSDYFDGAAEEFDVIVVPDMRAALKIAREDHEEDFRGFAEWGAAYLKSLTAKHGTIFFGHISGVLEDRWTYASDTVLELKRDATSDPVTGMIQKARNGRQGVVFELVNYKVPEPQAPKEGWW